MRDFALEIEQRKRDGLYRSRRLVSGPQKPELVADGAELLSFCSNDYLGLANHAGNLAALRDALPETGLGGAASHLVCGHHDAHHQLERRLDRKSTRLNSSHVRISYAVFCLKKKKNIHNNK